MIRHLKFCQDGNINLKKNYTLPLDDNDANVFNVRGAKVAVEDSVIEAFCWEVEISFIKVLQF